MIYWFISMLSFQQSVSLFMSWLNLDFNELTEVTLCVERIEGFSDKRAFSRWTHMQSLHYKLLIHKSYCHIISSYPTFFLPSHMPNYAVNIFRTGWILYLQPINSCETNIPVHVYMNKKIHLSNSFQ